MPVLISICIPTYKNTVSLRRLLTSIDDQDFRDFEVVICDDTPNQDVYEIISDFPGLPGLHYEQNSPRLGSPANWNRCISLANGEWIKIMHHDDWFSSPESLRMFAEATLELGGSPLLFSGCNAFRNGEHLSFCHCPFGDDGGVQKLHNLARYNLIFANRIGCPSVTMFRNKSGLRFDESLLWLVDVEFYLTAIALSGAVVLKRPLINVTFMADTQITSTVETDPSLRWMELLYLCEKHQFLQYAEVRIRLVRESHGISWADLLGHRHRIQVTRFGQLRLLRIWIVSRILIHRSVQGLHEAANYSLRCIKQRVHKLTSYLPFFIVVKR